MDGGDGMEAEPRGSNGFAIAPSKSTSGNALFLINPHTSFYFRPEVHAVSEEGLNAYGAVTWGNFLFIRDLILTVAGCTLLAWLMLLTCIKRLS